MTRPAGSGRPTIRDERVGSVWLAHFTVGNRGVTGRSRWRVLARLKAVANRAAIRLWWGQR